MSHVATVETRVTDLAALATAAKACGLEFVEGQTTFKWYGQWMNDYAKDDAAYKAGIKPEDYGKCLHAIRVPGDKKAYEIGVVKSPDGNGYLLLWDFYAGGHGLMQHVSHESDKSRTGVGKLLQHYGVAATKKMARRAGMMVKETWVNGEVKLICTT